RTTGLVVDRGFCWVKRPTDRKALSVAAGSAVVAATCRRRPAIGSCSVELCSTTELRRAQLAATDNPATGLVGALGGYQARPYRNDEFCQSCRGKVK
ncbi:MAG: hypothetical protein M1423_10665, partial [Acidobacteria bacterium]|nr:hypothetical protein [Acidobacteriota bacterium]